MIQSRQYINISQMDGKSINKHKSIDNGSVLFARVNANVPLALVRALIVIPTLMIVLFAFCLYKDVWLQAIK